MMYNGILFYMIGYVYVVLTLNGKLLVVILITDYMIRNSVGGIMIRYILFAISFLVLFTVFQVLAGYVATLLYTPDISSAWKEAGHASSEVVITGSSRIISLILA